MIGEMIVRLYDWYKGLIDIFLGKEDVRKRRSMIFKKGKFLWKRKKEKDKKDR